jgi:hypothetical protein
MAAGQGFKTFATGDVLTAADTNGYLMQGVWVFADAAARTAAVTSPQEGNISYLKDTDSTEYYSGSAWVAVGAAGGGMTLLGTPTTLSGGSTTISSISQAYNQLYLVITGVSFSATAGAYMNVRPNGSSSICSVLNVFGTNTTVNTQATASGNIAFNYNNSVLNNTNNAYVLFIDNYASTTNYKPYSGRGQYINNSSVTETVNATGNILTNTAITSLQFNADTSSFNGGTVKVYGVK